MGAGPEVSEDGVLYAEDFEGALDNLLSSGIALLDLDFPDLELRTIEGVALIGETRIAWFDRSDGEILAVVDAPRRVRRHRLARFFLLTTALFVPFWVLGAVKRVDLMPGLPIAALATFAPATAAAILVYREDGRKGVVAFLERSFDLGRGGSKVWYLPALLLMPAVMLVAYALYRLSGGPGRLPRITLGRTLALPGLFLVGALGEELGWSGYATEPMRERWGPLSAALRLGVVWAAYHLIALVQEGRDAEWIAAWTLNTVALRVLIVWLYENAGRSVLAAALFHAAANVTWQLFDVGDPAYYPGLVSLVTAGVAAIVAAADGNPSHSADTVTPDI